MKIVRQGAFETNSSSAHSLVLNKNCRSSRIKKELNKYYTLNLWLGEYGWEEAIYKDTISKLEYIVTSLLYVGDLGKLKELFIKIKDAGVTEIKVDGFILSYYDTVDDFVDTISNALEAIVDHQSSYLLKNLSVDELLMLACSYVSYIHTSNVMVVKAYLELYLIMSLKLLRKKLAKISGKNGKKNAKNILIMKNQIVVQ